MGNDYLHPSTDSAAGDDFDAKAKKVIVSRPPERVKPFSGEITTTLFATTAAGTMRKGR
jgi:hypothetical protein